MSMISAQCDELRERAKELRNLAPDPDVPYLVPSTKEIMALAMRSAAGEMEDAADTIWELRNKCADLVDERERLFRANVEKNNKILRLVVENAKLRELCRRFAEYVSQDRCEGCVCKRRCNNGEIDECWQRTEIREAAHEFGIEVAE